MNISLHNPPSLLVYAASDQAAAAWIAALYGAFPATPGGMPADQFYAALLWIALTGVVPVCDIAGPEQNPNPSTTRKKDPKKKFIPDVNPDALRICNDASIGPGQNPDMPRVLRRTVCYTDETTKRNYSVCIWMMPIIDDPNGIGVDGLVQNPDSLRYITPIAVAHAAHGIAMRRYASVALELARRANMPLMFRHANGTAPPGIVARDTRVMLAINADNDGRTTQSTSTVSVPDGSTHIPYADSEAPAQVFRLHRTVGFEALQSELWRPADSLPPFGPAHAAGIAIALNALMTEFGYRTRVQPAIYTETDAAPKSKRRKRAAEEISSDSEND